MPARNTKHTKQNNNITLHTPSKEKKESAKKKSFLKVTLNWYTSGIWYSCSLTWFNVLSTIVPSEKG